MKVVFDIDGTLSNPGHRLHFIQPEAGEKKNWEGFFAACGDDTPIPQTVKLCQELILADHSHFMSSSPITVEFWTGRREAERDTTVEWLNKHVVIREIYEDLLSQRYEDEARVSGGGDWASACEWADRAVGITLKMRKDGDRRPDYIIKMEFIDWDHPPDIIFEDRSRIVEAYRERGLTVFQVAEGDF